MNTRSVLLGAIASLAVTPLLSAANIDRATLTEVVNSVNIIEPASKKTTGAKVQQLFTAPNVLRTGPNSRAEMVAPDQTVTRVGQSTLFSFEPNSREIKLDRGSILFQSPSGKGGGTIRSSAASAAVLGTTLIVTTTKNGGFKVLLLEGKGRVKGEKGEVRILRGGQMVYALPGGKLSQAFEFRLSQQVGASRLVKGFKKELPSQDKIEAAISKQEKDIASGKAIATNLLASGVPTMAYQVDVAFDTLVNDEVEVAADPFVTASSSDAVISAPDLEEARLFGVGTPNTLNLAGIFTSAFGDTADQQQAASAVFFIANNITFDTPTVNLMPYAMNDLFLFLAVNDINFAQSVDFSSFTGADIQLLAGGTFTSAPGTVLKAASEILSLIALGSGYPLDGSTPDSAQDLTFEKPLELSDFGMENSKGGISVFGGDVKLAGVQFDASTFINLAAVRDLTIEGAPSGAQLKALSSPYNNGALVPPPDFSTINGRELVRIAAPRDISISRTAINSPSTTVDAGRVLKLTAVQINDGQIPRIPQSEPPQGGVTFADPSVKLYAREVADLRGVNFFANDVLIQSNTVRLENVNFRGSSLVILESQIGLLAANPNSGAPVVPGRVNFVRNVRYGGAPAQQALIQNGPSPAPPSFNSGVIVRPR